MKALIAALALLATPATAQEVVECDWRATAAALAEPWEDNSATFANGAVRIALLDTIDPAAGALHLLVLSPPFNELGDRQCRVVSHGQGVGFAGLYFSEAEFNFEPLGGDAVRVTYHLGYERLISLSRRVSLMVIFGAGLPLMLIVGAVVWFFVVNNAEPAVRWQVFQCFQIFHAIWPPFLLLSLYSMGRRHSKTFASNILATLELAD